MRFLFSLVFGLLLSGSSLMADILYSVTALGTLPGGDSSIGYGINNAGQVTGAASVPSPGLAHAFLYSNGQMTDITAGQVIPQGLSSGYAINSAGGAFSGHFVRGSVFAERHKPDNIKHVTGSFHGYSARADFGSR